MLLNINPSTGEVQNISEKNTDRVLESCDRLREELEGWLKYRKMAQTQGGQYNMIAAQEFQHALVALSDMFDSLKGRMSPEELTQFNKFRNECVGKP